MVKILVVDDHTLVRKGVIRFLEGSSDLKVSCDEAASGTDALRLATAGDYRLMLLDISLPGVNGLELLKTLRRECPKTPILVLTMHPEEQYGVRALILGAAGYLTKESLPEELVQAVGKVLEGGRFITPGLAERLAAHLGSASGKGSPQHEELSDREFEVLRLIGAGRTPAQIAAHLFLSVKTVSTYRSRLLHKLALRSTAELMNYALKHRLTE